MLSSVCVSRFFPLVLHTPYDFFVFFNPSIPTAPFVRSLCSEATTQVQAQAQAKAHKHPNPSRPTPRSLDDHGPWTSVQHDTGQRVGETTTYSVPDGDLQLPTKVLGAPSCVDRLYGTMTVECYAVLDGRPART
ncbi:uncharacterized protein CCOS01_15730 [Colletotrichum costaricense]|uniref:Uncharacterized protein n=1 Tax=Colletotrichum costaricense TaxID=1209916 RepID=A0AAI9YH88_9PEZI|nr:uncharacterized protein CCOS01_15730 [Colletotrichum costaricense]KAK1509214.1 hypothetical protein CCOS01_15730 [Colletotrichum costaricense]